MRIPLLLSPLALWSCGESICPPDDASCAIQSACEGLSFSCEGGEVRAYRIEQVEQIPGGSAASAAIGDIVLENDQVQVVIEALDHPHFIAITGGSIIDMVVRDQPHDSLRHLWQATGLLPLDYVVYDQIEILEEGDVRAVQVSGILQDRPETSITTRYEIRPCEPGVRIRTELLNLEPEPASWTLLDGLYFGGGENLGFAPFPGGGFDFRSFGLGDLTAIMTPVPYVIAGMHTAPAATYASVPCERETTSTFLSEEIVPVGLPPALVMPRDYLVFERFFAVADGAAVSAGADIALEIRSQLFDESYTELSGRVVLDDGLDGSNLADGVRAVVTISEGTRDTPIAERIPWTAAIPDAEGRFTVRVPTGRSFVAEVEAMGQVVGEAEVTVGADPADLGEIGLPSLGALRVGATLGEEDGDELQILVFPADEATEEASRGRYLDHFDTCAPFLGHPYGGSPACNRILVREGEPIDVQLVPGRYDLFAVAGPFSTLARELDVVIATGTSQEIHLDLEHIDGLQPDETLSADFHVHARSSFDTSFPDRDRVRAVLAARLDVIASTEHDSVFDFSSILEELGGTDRLALMNGTESTGHALWYWNDTVAYPQVTGHWIIWPLPYDPSLPYQGAPWDELAEPGLLFTRAEEAGWPADEGVLQLNHPVGGSQLGRDFGWVSALLLDGTEPLSDDPTTRQGQFSRTPEGAAFANDAFHAQEVMNGTNNGSFLAYRAFWHYLLNEGVLRAGTANSDSHSLTDNVVGSPRNLVQTDTTVAGFDAARFNRSVREGRMTGTNGPVLLVYTEDAQGDRREPALVPFAPASDGELHIEVRAAPWVEVEEVRIIVNGEVVERLTDLTPAPDDPTSLPGTPESLIRLQTSIPLAELLPETGDAWISVEAGAPLMLSADLDCNGWPDTGDHNGDGTVDWRDVEEAEGPPESECFPLGEAGTLLEPEAPTDPSSTAYAFAAVQPGAYPLAFTNPLVFDLDGDGDFTGSAQ